MHKFQQLSWLLLPPVFVFIILNYIFLSFSAEISNWLLGMAWLSYACLGISSIIAALFARSRLVFLCLLALLFSPIGLSFAEQLSVNFVPLDFFVLASGLLLISKDKGFGPINLFYAALIAISLLAIVIFILPMATPYMAEALNATGVNVISTNWPQLHSYQIGLMLMFIAVATPVLIIRPNSSNMAITYAVLLAVYMHLNLSIVPNHAILILLAVLICFAIIKDSFTMAFKDELTAIPSRRALMQYVQTLGRKYTVVMSDIDHFKKFNDRHGHDVGDEVLKLVASKLNKVSGGGKAFRFGGEEFVIVFPRKQALEAKPFVEMVRQTIEDYDIALRAKPRPAKPPKSGKSRSAKSKAQIVKVTSSFGIAQRTATASSFEQVMKQADIALYSAKKAGRNCVVVAKQ